MAIPSYRPHHPKVNFSELNFPNVDFNSPLQNIILDVRPFIEQGREYSYIAAKYIIGTIASRSATNNELGSCSIAFTRTRKVLSYFLEQYVKFGTEFGQSFKCLRELDLEYLNFVSNMKEIVCLTILVLIHYMIVICYIKKGYVMKLSNIFWMRVVMGLLWLKEMPKKQRNRQRIL